MEEENKHLDNNETATVNNLSQSSGSQRVVQPSESFVKEVSENPQLTAPAISNRNFESTVNVYDSATADQTTTKHTQNMDDQKPTSRKTTFIIIVALMVLIGVAAAGYFLLNNKESNSNHSDIGSNSIKKPESPTDFEKSLSKYPDYITNLNKFTMPVFVPADDEPERPIISAHVVEGILKERVQYAINSQYGMGIVPGTYAVSMFTLPSDYDPPKDCGLPLGGKASSPIACSYFEGSDKDMPAYTYSGVQPGSITNTEVPKSSYLTIYVKRGNQLITVQTSESSPENLYAFVKNMKQIHPLELPADTTVSFD